MDAHMRHASLIAYIVASILFLCVAPMVYGQTGNAEVTRRRNQQPFLLEPNNADATRNRNTQNSELEPNNADVTRNRNIQTFELEPNNADVVRQSNSVQFELEPNDADTTRERNLLWFELEPNDADVIRYRNLQYFLLEPLLYAYKINVTSLEITDQGGTPTSTFLRGDIAQLTYIVQNQGGPENLPLENGLISIAISDSSNTPIFLSYTFGDLPRSASKEFITGYQIPIGGSTGTYTVKVMVFTDWPSEGGIGLAIKQSTFSVV